MHERKVRDGEDAIASTRDACAPQNERLALRKDSQAAAATTIDHSDRDYPFAGTGGGGSQSKKEEWSEWDERHRTRRDRVSRG
jgi:hypothetical protein